MQRFTLFVVLLGLGACGKTESSSSALAGSGSSVPAGSASGAVGSGPAPGSGATSDPGSGSGSGASASASAGSGSGLGLGSGSASGTAITAGSGSGSATKPKGDGAGSSSDAAFDFDKLTHDERVSFMKSKVLPQMKAAFQKFDGKKYAKFTCKTCHGKDPVKAKYEMPNPELPKLDFAALKAGKQEPKIAEFMGKVIEPEMGKLLHKPLYSEKNPDGFGCLDCHFEKK